MDLGPLQRHAAGHDETDVAAAQDDHVFAGQIALHVHQPLGGAGAVNAGGPGAGDVQGAPGPLPAAHGQHDGLGLDLNEPRLPSGDGQYPIFIDVQHHSAQQVGDFHSLHPVDEPLGVLRARQLLAEGVEAEAGVDALVEDTAQRLAPLDDENVLQARLPGGNGGCQPRRAAAYNSQLYLLHAHASLVMPCTR